MKYPNRTRSGDDNYLLAYIFSFYPQLAEGPQHQVTLSAFRMGKYPVTQEQYQAVMGNNPSNFKMAVTGESNTPEKLPVERVSWYDTLIFCIIMNTLSTNCLTIPCNPFYHLNINV